MTSCGFHPHSQKRTEERTETHACDCISRQSAIDTLDKHLRTTDVPVSYPGIISALTEWLNELPSAQADSKETSSTHKALDTVSRQAALDWMKNEWNGMVTSLFDGIKALPSAQAEIVRCKDCKYNSNTCGNYVDCDIIPQMFGRTVDNFCSRAERKTDE